MTDYYDRWPFMAEHTDGFYEEAVGIVLKHCDPRAVWIFFPEPFDETDDWYEGSDVCLCIVIDGGDSARSAGMCARPSQVISSTGT